MFQINVTELVNNVDCSRFASSIWESGRQDIGKVTWQNAVEYIETSSALVKPEQQQDLRDWIAGFGAWTDAEIAAMSDTETNALLLQFIAGDIREYESLPPTDKGNYMNGCQPNLVTDAYGAWWYVID